MKHFSRKKFQSTPREQKYKILFIHIKLPLFFSFDIFTWFLCYSNLIYTLMDFKKNTFWFSYIYISFSIIDGRGVVKRLITLNLYLLKAHSWIRTLDLRCDTMWYDLTQSSLRTISVTVTIFFLVIYIGIWKYENATHKSYY